MCDAEREGSPPESFGKSIEYIYDRYILLRTWLAIRVRLMIELPTEIEILIEAVYGTESVVPEGGWNEAMENAKSNMESKQTNSQNKARNLLVLEPGDPLDIIEKFNTQLIDDEDPEVHQAVKAATREGDPSITVVIIEHDTILMDKPDKVEVRKLLDRSAKLSHRGIYHGLVKDGVVPGEWTSNAHLRHARLLRLNEQNQVEVDGFTLTVDEKLGVVIEKEVQSNG